MNIMISLNSGEKEIKYILMKNSSKERVVTIANCQITYKISIQMLYAKCEISSL